jgi:hypothetical protein
MLGGMAVALPLPPPSVVTMPPRTSPRGFMPFPGPDGCLLASGPATPVADLTHVSTPITHVGLQASQSPRHTVSIRRAVNLSPVMGSYGPSPSATRHTSAPIYEEPLG